MCAELGLTQILATPAYPPGAVPLARLVAGFGELCARAAAQGLWVNLEPMPFTGCPDVAATWAIVAGAAAPNCGIMLDSWHFFRAGQTLAALDAVPERYFQALQLSDAPLVPAAGPLARETITARRWPGQGELPLHDFVRAVYAKGFLRAVGQKVFNPAAADSRPAEEVGRVAGATVGAVLRAAGVPRPA